jgi:hypothetical protein
MRQQLFRNQSRFVLGEARRRGHIEHTVRPNNRLQRTVRCAARRLTVTLARTELEIT